MMTPRTSAMVGLHPESVMAPASAPGGLTDTGRRSTGAPCFHGYHFGRLLLPKGVILRAAVHSEEQTAEPLAHWDQHQQLSDGSVSTSSRHCHSVNGSHNKSETFGDQSSSAPDCFSSDEHSTATVPDDAPT